jgi:hypothetical protein
MNDNVMNEKGPHRAGGGRELPVRLRGFTSEVLISRSQLVPSRALPDGRILLNRETGRLMTLVESGRGRGRREMLERPRSFADAFLAFARAQVHQTYADLLPGADASAYARRCAPGRATAWGINLEEGLAIVMTGSGYADLAASFGATDREVKALVAAGPTPVLDELRRAVKLVADHAGMAPRELLTLFRMRPKDFPSAMGEIMEGRRATKAGEKPDIGFYNLVVGMTTLLLGEPERADVKPGDDPPPVPAAIAELRGLRRESPHEANGITSATVARAEEIVRALPANAAERPEALALLGQIVDRHTAGLLATRACAVEDVGPPDEDLSQPGSELGA